MFLNTLSMLPIPLLQWYREHARVLPWRTTPDPYRVWVSEIMLQQTRVTAVLGYFARFLAAFPTIRDLANAPEDVLMKQWQGLGYYSRARNLQKAARQIVDEHGGLFPTDYKAIRAIASICFGQPVPAVDGNLLRVAARVLADATDITTTQGKRHFTQALQEVIPVDFPGQFNQAMMDLGATVCLPNGAPLCAECPAADFCLAKAQGIAQNLPTRPVKKPRRVEERVVFLLFHEGQVALRRRPSKGLLAGLWEYPNELAPAEDALTQWGLADQVAGAPEFAGTGKHIFTHVEWRMTAQRVELLSPVLPAGWVWADRAALEHTYALPSALAPFRSAAEEGLA